MFNFIFNIYLLLLIWCCICSEIDVFVRDALQQITHKTTNKFDVMPSLRETRTKF